MHVHVSRDPQNDTSAQQINQGRPVRQLCTVRVSTVCQSELYWRHLPGKGFARANFAAGPQKAWG